MTGPIRTPFESQTLRGLNAALGGLSQRQTLIADNIANVDTPGFHARDVSFEGALAKAIGDDREPLAMDISHPDHLGGTLGLDKLVSQVPTTNTAMRNDGNNVDVDREMSRLAETNIRYTAVANLVTAKYAQIKSAVNDGRR